LPGYRTFETEINLLPRQEFTIKTELVKGSITQADPLIKKQPQPLKAVSSPQELQGVTVVPGLVVGVHREFFVDQPTFEQALTCNLTSAQFAIEFKADKKDDSADKRSVHLGAQS
jgi:hypothetical protein